MREPYALDHPEWNIETGGEDNHVDLPRMEQAGMNAPFMVVYTPFRLEPADAMDHALKMFDLIHGWAESCPDRLVLARSPAEVLAARKSGKISMVICMENGSPVLPGRLDLLRTYYRLGARYLSLCHNRTNHLCDSSMDKPIHQGVSEFGRRVIEEANRLGIMLDVSHISDKSVRDHLRYSKAPILASHSNARALCNHPRNLPDDLIREITGRGGVIQLNFAGGFISPSCLAQWNAKYEKIKPRIEALEKLHGSDHEKIRKEITRLLGGEPTITPPPLEDWFGHLEYLVKLVGVDSVGLGSDFDGVSVAPREITDVTSLRVLTMGLLKRGWPEEDIRKFYGGNLLRFWRQVELVRDRWKE